MIQNKLKEYFLSIVDSTDQDYETFEEKLYII